jgi:hypothetical protein
VKFRLSLLIVALVALLVEPASAGFLNDMNSAFRVETQSWLENALNVAELIFGTVMGVYIIFVLCKAALASLSSEVSIGTVLWPLGNMLFFLIGPLIILKVGARELLPNIIGAAGQLSSMITGQTVSVAQPDDIFVIGKGFADKFWQATSAPLTVQPPQNLKLGMFDVHALVLGGLETLLGAFVYIVMMLAFGIIAFEVLTVYVEVYIAIAIGAISLGWLGSEGTAYMASGYIQAVWATILRLIVIFSFVALLGGFLTHWTILKQAVDPGLFMQSAGEIVAASLGALYVTLRLGRMCEKLSGGSAALYGTDLFNSGLGAVNATVGALRKSKRED